MSPIAPRLATALLDRYQLVRELGQGGMATVYLAHDVRHGRDVALKVLRPELAAILGRERFLAEIRLTAKLDHPHILTLIDSGEAEGHLWYALPYVRGESLRQRLNRDRQLSLADALAIVGDIASALEYAHSRGVIHRDVKPENIMIHEGEAMLTDFGIALAVREAGGERLTEVQHPKVTATLSCSRSCFAFSANSGQFDAPSTTTGSIFLPSTPPWELISSNAKRRMSRRDVSLIAIVPDKE